MYSKLSTLFTLVAVCGLGAGCAHTHSRGSVVMKDSETQAHICLGKDDVKVGDKLSVIENVCKGSGKGRSCKTVTVSNAEVSELLDDHYSTVKLESGTAVKPGMMVEKK